MANAGHARILLIDDDPDQLKLYRHVLESNFEVVATRSPRDALELLRSEQFDLVLSDYRMPEMTGVELLTKARHLQPLAQRVVMSAFVEAAPILPAIDAGDVHHFASKPVKVADLQAWLASVSPESRQAPLSCVVVGRDSPQVAAILDELGGHAFEVKQVATLAKDVRGQLILYVNPGDVHEVESGVALLGRTRQEIAVMVALPPDDAADAAGYFAAGVDDVVWLPVRSQELALRFHTWRSRREAAHEAERVRKEAISREPFPEILGRSLPMRKVFHQVHRVAPTDASILLVGETGTGKEMIARVVHALSTRRQAPFHAVNLSAMPETLVESELFGHEKGAFTGAQATRRGRLEAVEGGTLFLDEIGDLSQAIQVKLLRVLEERTFERLGATSPRKADFRLVCATHRNLEELVGSGEFREDLYYRINVVSIELPPLRERGDDVRLLAEHFLASTSQKYGVRDVRLSDRALQTLMRHHWPGNVRELKHAIERATAMSQDGALLDEEVLWLRPERKSFKREVETFLADEKFRGLDEVLAELERTMLYDTLQRCGGNQVAAARKLKIPRQTLQHRLKKYGL